EAVVGGVGSLGRRRRRVVSGVGSSVVAAVAAAVLSGVGRRLAAVLSRVTAARVSGRVVGGVAPGVLLVFDALESDGAVPGRVAGHGVAGVDLAGGNRERLVVGSHRLLVLAVEEAQVAI